MLKTTTAFLIFAFKLLLMTTAYSQDLSFSKQLFDTYDTYRESALTHRRFKQIDILPLIDQLKTDSRFEVTTVGESVEKRPIQMIKVGSGPRKVLLWSQMHGDEPSATMALFDIFNLLRTDGPFEDFKKQLLAETTLYFVPMLNPDGAERYQRRNALDIDLNRDALRLQSPESRILKGLQQSLKPDFGFNLHDQGTRYSAGPTPKQATISFLATAYDEARNINPVRERSMQLIVGMNRVLQQYIPGGVGRFSDEFEPRAFGDNIQKWGTTLILIESGGYPNDPEKQFIRKLNYVAILSGLQAIATDAYKTESRSEYNTIPENERYLFDVLIRNAQIMRGGKPITVDLGINRYEVNVGNAATFGYRSVIDDFGDLSTFFGIEEIDATGLTLAPGKIHPQPLRSLADLKKYKLDSLVQQGVTTFRLATPSRATTHLSPIHLLQPTTTAVRPVQTGRIPTFVLRRGNQLRYVFVNGFWYDVNTGENKLATGVIE
ncbi:zinc carboxypeptidase [Larkinella arboricola]|uniref:Zinc carboxypeptidase n=1 Tax=Larkinella arboricola TaxID=643671 RepID=A0A327WY58_LARAB|nr:M14 metallopeptidase family protein [Larkinella arboricola]RAJ98083.1 zinc carboxypeptidase [Larkinella arboricola]